MYIWTSSLVYSHEPYERFGESFNDVFSLTPHALQIGFLKLLQGFGLERSKDYDYVYDPKAPYEVLATHVMPYDEIRFFKAFLKMCLSVFTTVNGCALCLAI